MKDRNFVLKEVILLGRRTEKESILWGSLLFGYFLMDHGVLSHVIDVGCVIFVACFNLVKFTIIDYCRKIYVSFIAVYIF